MPIPAVRGAQRVLIFSLLAVALAATSAAAAPAKLARAEPRDVGLHPGRLGWIEHLVASAIGAGRLPGCVVLVGRHGQIGYSRSFGDRQVEPTRLPMTVDTVFDLASITKPVATATSVMILIERGKLRLDDRVATHWPEFAAHGKQDITVEQLLTHTAGLIPDNALADYGDGADEARRRIAELKPSSEPGTKFVYSDVGYLVLGELVRRVSGQSVADFARDNIFAPLGMNATGYLPNADLRARAAPTEQRDGRWIQGEVHDPRAHALAGVAGHAGLFSTAEDLAIYAQAMLQGGRLGDARILAADSVARMIAPRTVGERVRALGWDVRTPYSINRGELNGPRSFGHGGFTGTVLWIDPDRDSFLVFLSSRLHPDGKGEVNRLAGQIGTVVGAAIEDQLADARSGKVLTGVDVFARNGCKPLVGRRVGLITNHTGKTRDGRSTIEVLKTAENVDLAALFSSEHGIAGKLDVPQIADAKDDATGLPVFSLYGETRKPTPESLRGLDTLVFDIQDIGTRFYTYVSTMGLAMQAAAEHKLRFVVLDRPNPIGGVAVEGPVLDAGSESFVGFHRLPVRHGMTAGELARMFNDELKLNLDLHVVTLEGWRRGEDFDATGLAWVNPSPNMRNVVEAYLYPGVGLLETTNVSVGRGTETPFEVIGAPWIDGDQLAQELNDAKLPGVRFLPTRFVPQASTHQGKRCGGVCIIILDRAALEPARMGIEIAVALRRLYPGEWEVKGYSRLLGHRATIDALAAGKSAVEIAALWQDELSEFRNLRTRYLLYEGP